MQSPESNEQTSRDISIFFAILCFELDKQGKNFLDALRYAEFSIEEVNELFEDSSTWAEVIRACRSLADEDARRKLITTTMARRNIVVRNGGDRFSFTRAYKLFIDYARELVPQESN